MNATIPEHAPVWAQIHLALEARRMPQALLLVGPRHVGVDSFVKRLVSLLLCKATGHKPCGLCDACHLLLVNTHPDFKHIFPETVGGVVKVDQVRSLQENVYHTPQCGQHLVVWISHADKMNAAAANALLKILEEPPSHVYFILVAEQLSTLPATVISRCSRMVFPDAHFDATNYLSLGACYPPDSHRAKLYAKRYAVVSALCDIVLGQVSPCQVAAEWADDALLDWLWLLYLIFAQAIQIQLLRVPREGSDHDALDRFARLLSPVELSHHLDNLRAHLKKLSQNITMNATLTLESILCRLQLGRL